MNEMTVVEMGELMEMYSIAVAKFRALRIELNEQLVKRFFFFWRLRDDPREVRSNSTRLVHFHMHFAPDVEGLMDPVLESEAHDWDPAQLVIEPGAL